MRNFMLVIGVIFSIAAAIEFVPILVGCGIKGNISFEKGERIYHMPGQEYYFATPINPFHGERWFCSESDARAAGWRQPQTPRRCEPGKYKDYPRLEKPIAFQELNDALLELMRAS